MQHALRPGCRHGTPVVRSHVMNQTQVDGMRARSAGLSRQANPYPAGAALHHDWQSGWEILDEQIAHVLGNAEGMVDGLARLRLKMDQRGRNAPVAKQPELAEVAQ